MNQSDKRLIILILGISFFSIVFLFFNCSKGAKKAIVYRKNQIILAIPLVKEEKKYEVEGALGKVEIQVKDFGIMVEKETSPKHLCSKQGYIKETYETIVCLPNEIVVKIVSDDTLDTVVK